jgi:hypothetical protein
MSDSVDRKVLGSMIADCLRQEREAMTAQWTMPGRVRSCIIDDLLPQEIVERIHSVFPQPKRMVLKKSIRENKHVAAQMDQHDPLME